MLPIDLRASRAPLWLAFLAASACGGGDGGPDDPTPSAFPVIVSEGIDRAVVFPGAASGRVAFVSAVPGQFARGASATFINARTGEQAVAAIVDGGIDPVVLPAEDGDAVSAIVVDSTGEVVEGLIETRAKPRVVRSSPSPQRRDVPLNLRVGVVFSTPIDLETAATGISLRRDGLRVPIEVEAEPGDPTRVAIVTGELSPSASYELIVTRDVRDVTGAPIDEEFRADFVTGENLTPDTPSGIDLEGLLEVPEPLESATAETYRRKQVEVGGVLLLRARPFRNDGSAFGEPLATQVRWTVSTPGTIAVQEVSTNVLRITGLAEGRGEVIAEAGTIQVPYELWITAMPAAEAAPLPVIMRWENRSLPGPVPWLLGATSITGGFAVISTNGAGVGFTPLRAGTSASQQLRDDGMPTRANGRLVIAHMLPWDGASYYPGEPRPLLELLPDGLATEFTATAAADFCPRWAPDRTRLAFGRQDATGASLWLREADGSTRELTRTTGPACPFWAPAGDRIAFVDGPVGGKSLAVLALTPGATPLRLDTGPLVVTASGPWSPDGREIAIGARTSPTEPHDDVYLVPAGGGAPRALGQKGRPTDWSDDGRHLLVTTAFGHERFLTNTWLPTGGSWVHLVRADGSSSRALMPGRDGIFAR